jgi:sugar lactone lactonase YvrE
MPTRLARPAVAALLCLSAAAISIRAATPTFWRVSTQDDFLAGEAVEHVAIDEAGRLVLAPRQDVLHAPAAPFLWDVVIDPAGRPVVATGSDGQVLRVAGDGAPTVLFDASEPDVHALARGAGATLFAGTSPDGQVYRLDGEGRASAFFDPGDKYIWALARDEAGVLYVATGDKGHVYRVTPEGAGALWLDTRAANATALALGPGGTLLVGTEGPGQVLRVDAQGRAFVLLDAAQREIRRLRLDAAGNLYALAVPGRGAAADSRPAERTASAPTAPPTGMTPVVSTEITVTAIGDVPVTQGAVTPKPARSDALAAVYRITPDGNSEAIWQSGEDVPYDVAVDGDEILVATGPRGRIYRVAGAPHRATLVARALAQQVTAFATAPDGARVYVTSNPGRVVRMAPGRADRGVYESDVRDAGAVTPGGSRVEVATRSGNTPVPDDRWSAWSAPCPDPDGSPIASPTARYLQWRVTLVGGPTDGPAVSSVTAAYLPRNTRPSIESITVHPPGVVFLRPFSTGETEIAGFAPVTPDGRPAVRGAQATAAAALVGRRTYQKGFQTLQWKAEDADQDRLRFDVHYRRDGDTEWRVLETGLWDPLLTWDTATVPDGAYTVKVTASDAAVNAAGRALGAELESAGFDVDNTPPVIEAAAPAAAAPGPWTIVVRDAQSAVLRLEYSVAGGPWTLVSPADGLADGRTERFEVTGAALDRGVVVAFRATDALDNVGTLAVTIR